MFDQCVKLRPKKTFRFKNNGNNGRIVTFKAEDHFWICSTKAYQKTFGLAMVCRKSQGIGSGYYFSLDMVSELFNLES